MLQDFKFAWRSLSRSPLFAFGAIATLALGIGVNSTIFTITNGALFKSLAGIVEPSQLVWISGMSRERPRPGGLAYLEYLDYRDRSTDVFSNVLAFAPAAFSLGSGGDPQRIRGHVVSGSYFGTLGITAIAGRTLQASDDQRGATAAAVISFRLWRQRFGGRLPEAPIVVNDREVTVVGVAPEGFVGPELGQSADLWLPLSALPVVNTTQATWLRERGTLWLRVIGRRRAGVSGQQVQAWAGGVAAALGAEHPDTNKDRIALISSASSGVTPSERSELLPLAALLLTITGLVLAIACANVANLLLARGASRSMEISIRAAVGASRWRIVRQLLAESVVLSGAGAAGGLLVSFWTSDFLLARLPERDFGGLHTATDARVLLFTALVAAASACAFGLTPALSATRRALLPRLRETTAAGGRSRMQGLFVVTQLSLSLVLLLAAGLSLRALQKASAIDLGFNPDDLLTASYDLALQNYPSERRDAFRRELSARIAALPGAISVTFADVPPLSGTMVGTSVSAVDDHGRIVESRAYLSSIGASYFRTLDIPVLRGRGVEWGDGRGAPEVGVVNESLARQLWPKSDPIGQTLQFEGHALRVVGVARDARYDEATEDPRPFLYLSLPQHSQLDRETVIVRSAILTGTVIQGQIHQLDAALPVFDVRPFDALLRDRSDKQRALSALFAAFGSLALLLASIGLYGVMSYAVTRRTHEIGVRLALGATPRQLISLIARDGFRLALTGVAIGSALALPLAPALGALVFGVQVSDLATFAATCTLLVAVAMGATLLPALRAARTDPIAALRTE